VRQVRPPAARERQRDPDAPPTHAAANSRMAGADSDGADADAADAAADSASAAAARAVVGDESDGEPGGVAAAKPPAVAESAAKPPAVPAGEEPGAPPDQGWEPMGSESRTAACGVAVPAVESTAGIEPSSPPSHGHISWRLRPSPLALRVWSSDALLGGSTSSRMRPRVLSFRTPGIFLTTHTPHEFGLRTSS
jgi:hypothetical protein